MKKLAILITCLISILVSVNRLSAQPAWHMTSRDVTNLHSAPADYRIKYGQQENEFIELRLPKGNGPYPVAILIHGGCWNSNFADFNNLSALADALRDNGIATWNIEYQSLNTLGNKWQKMFFDISAGADILSTYAKKYNLNLNKVIVIGHSAGGHLALWLAGRKNLPMSSDLYSKTPLKLLGVLSLGGVPDLEKFRPEGIKTCGTDMIRLMRETQPNYKINYNEISPARLLPLKTPQVLVTSNADASVNPMNDEAHAFIAHKKGDSVKLIILNNVGHHEYIAPQSLAWSTILRETKTLLHI